MLSVDFGYELRGREWFTDDHTLASNGSVSARAFLELVGLEGNVVQTVTTAYEGFFVISKIPVGNYRLRVSERQLDELGLAADRVEDFAISTNELFINGLDFVLREVSR